MKMQYLCQFRFSIALPTLLAISALAAADDIPPSAVPAHDYPTVARVEYVSECLGRNGDKLAALYQCSCVIDRIANLLSYDDYVEQSTFAKYAALPGQTGSIFRDSDEARQKARSFRQLETAAARACGLTQ